MKKREKCFEEAKENLRKATVHGFVRNTKIRCGSSDTNHGGLLHGVILLIL
jgi:hypothetical protein